MGEERGRGSSNGFIDALIVKLMKEATKALSLLASLAAYFFLSFLASSKARKWPFSDYI